MMLKCGFFFLRNPYRCIQDINLKMFQFSVLHMVIANNKKRQYDSLISKMTINVIIVASRWKMIAILFVNATTPLKFDWIYKLGIKLDCLTDSQVLFGERKWDPVAKRIIIQTKY